MKILEQKNMDSEVQLSGAINMLCGMLAGPPGYSQMKLAAINSIIAGKSTPTRVPGFVSAGILAALLLSGLPLVAYVPRFWLSGILYNVGIGFMIESFVDTEMTIRQRIIIFFMTLAFLLRPLASNVFAGLSVAQPNLRGTDAEAIVLAEPETNYLNLGVGALRDGN